MKTCSIKDCCSPVLAKGFCRKHYLRNYKHGNPDLVKNPSDYALSGSLSPNFKHGMWNHPLYKTWSNMMRRCYNENDAAYKNYGARGVFVCERWHSIENFVSDMGDKPEGLSLDRIDNNGPYSPDNCRWASDKDQSRNRRFAKLTKEKADLIRKMKAEGLKRKELAEKFGVSEATIKKVLSYAYWA